MTHFSYPVPLSALALFFIVPAYGAGLGQHDSAAAIEEVVVQASSADRALTARSAAEAREALGRIPGAIGFVEQAQFADDFAQSIGDTLVFTPGVFADTSAQRENRISIRGSGLNSSFERRGISLYRDGVPVTRASGSTEFQEVDPVTLQYIEVYKGANGLQYGGSSLGGVINMVTPTGRTADERWNLRVEGGSFGTTRGSLAYAESGERTDIYAAVTRLKADGYREHSAVDSVYAFANIGVQLSDALENRTHLTVVQDDFELAGSLSLDDALSDETLAGKPVTIGPFFPGGPVRVLDPGPVTDDWDRNLDVLRLANHFGWQGESVDMTFGGWYSRRELDHAITRFAGIIDQEEDEGGIFARASGATPLRSDQLEWTAGVEHNRATNDARTWQNLEGERGALSSRSDQNAWNLLAYGQVDLPLAGQLRGIAGLQALRTSRRNTAIVNDVNGYVQESQLNPRLGLLWQTTHDVAVFANLSRGFEPASLSDLTAGGALDFTPLKAQQAWTLEVGTRGSQGAITWDLAAYRSDIENEMLDFGLPGANGFISFTDNAQDTLHQGIEAGVDLHVAQSAFEARGLSLIWRQLYTLNDFRFQGDPVYQNNDLAGVPRHLYLSELQLKSPGNWYATLNVRWVPEGPWVDFQNTTQVPDYVLLGATAGVDLTPSLRVFASLENLTDERYISNTGTNANQALENSRIFTPGQGRAAFAGLTLRL